MKKKFIISISAMTIIAIIFLFLAYSGTDNRNANTDDIEFQVYMVEKSPPLLFKGVSEPKDVREYYLDPGLGEIKSLLVEDGDEISKSQVISVYINKSLQEEIDILKEELETINLTKNHNESNLNKSTEKKGQIESFINKYEKQRDELKGSPEDKQQELVELTSKIEQLQIELEVQEDSIVQFRQSLEEINLSRSILNERILNLEDNITKEVVSPINGIAYINESGTKDSSVPYARIITKDTIIKGFVTEYDYENLELNQEVTITSLNQSITTKGKIISINSIPETDSEATGISIYAFYLKPTENIPYGYNVQISLDLNQLKIPREALIIDGNEQFVYMYSNKSVQKKRIKVQEVAGEYIIKDGLDEGNLIIRNPNDNLHDGKEVLVNDSNE